MAQRLKAEVLAGRVQDRWRIRDCAGLLRENVRLSSDDVRSIAEHLVALAADATDPPLSRGLEQEAAVWFRDHDANAMNGCIERIAHTYVAEARVAADANAGALAEGFFLENAISTLRTLPRRYRTDRGLEDLIAALRQRLTTSREIAIESMMRIDSEPIDLAGAVAYARSQVSGQGSAWEALAQFASLIPPMDRDQTRASALDLLRGSISRLLLAPRPSRGMLGRSRQARLPQGNQTSQQSGRRWFVPCIFMPGWSRRD